LAAGTFAGWNTQADGSGASYTDSQSIKNLTTRAGATVTLFAKWEPITIVPGSSLADKLAWLQANAISNVDYTVEVNADENISADLSYGTRTNIGVTLISTGAERVIGLLFDGSLFTVGNRVTFTLDNNITLQGKSNNNSLVQVNSGGTLIMNTGSHITGNIAPSSSGGGVKVNGGTFTMNGGKISGNTGGIINGGGGVMISPGTFTMNGGKISGNTSGNGINSGGAGVYVSGGTFTMNGGEISSNTSAGSGGGVYLSAGDFIMIDGEISGNTARTSGGGVFVSNSNVDTKAFTKTGGTIYGYSASDIANSNVVKNGSDTVLDDQGHAVYVGGGIGTVKRKETTADPGVGLSWNYNGSSSVWSGAWDF
jgi:hypothetical protein